MRETRHEETKTRSPERAHQRGYQAGIAGRSKEMCPYQSLNQRSWWLGGWREAMEDRVLTA
ncbi:ribosome modulation factor [Klebsiella pneumoniae]|uniref:Ribosome modulation factor n=1 Tax=Klebsiella pneumoniae TaxID=573 RepID=A0A5C2LIA0_KLEPN|nr:ribosome modulation factor [Klebsiella pneumoniae]QEP92504.1 ribosome modulation factor [Klebsiella pneumoniae]RRE17961.1 ribosome modulation factor [Klebsiella pneumoniae]RRE26151.1 ribosome modulation factor [Klebsiella pneumoniae]RRE56493.1 ribosome modulation factor [Klebsiella pneumoniae]